MNQISDHPNKGSIRRSDHMLRAGVSGAWTNPWTRDMRGGIRGGRGLRPRARDARSRSTDPTPLISMWGTVALLAQSSADVAGSAGGANRCDVPTGPEIRAWHQPRQRLGALSGIAGAWRAGELFFRWLRPRDRPCRDAGIRGSAGAGGAALCEDAEVASGGDGAPHRRGRPPHREARGIDAMGMKEDGA